MTDSDRTVPTGDRQQTRWEPLGIAAFVLGLAAALVYFAQPLPAGLLAAAAVGFGLASRRKLRADPDLRGAGLSGVGFIVGAVVLALSLVMFLAPMILVLLAR